MLSPKILFFVKILWSIVFSPNLNMLMKKILVTWQNFNQMVYIFGFKVCYWGKFYENSGTKIWELLSSDLCFWNQHYQIRGRIPFLSILMKKVFIENMRAQICVLLSNHHCSLLLLQKTCLYQFQFMQVSSSGEKCKLVIVF